MTLTKDWYKSKTILAGAAVVLVSAARLGGCDVSAEDSQQVVDSAAQVVSHVLDVITLVAGAIAIIGRWRAQKVIAPVASTPPGGSGGNHAALS